MRLSILPLVASVLLLSACSSGDDAAMLPSATVTPTGVITSPTAPAEPSPSATPGTSPTPEASPTPDPNKTPQSGSTINADNFATLDLAFDAVLDMPQYMAWQDDGRLLVASRNEASLIDPIARATEPAFTADAGEAIVSISGAGRIAVSPDNRTIDVHDTSGTLVSTIQPQSQFGSVSFSSDGSKVAVSRLDEIAVDIWDVSDGSLVQEVTGFQTAAPVYSARFGPDDASIVWTSRATVQVTDLTSGELGPPMDEELFVNSIDTPATGNSLVTTWAAFATLWDIGSGQRIQDLDQLVSAFEPALLPDAQLLMVATDEGVKLWDTSTFQEVSTLDAPARQIEVSGDRHFLATLDQDGYLQVFTPPKQ